MKHNAVIALILCSVAACGVDDAPTAPTTELGMGAEEDLPADLVFDSIASGCMAITARNVSVAVDQWWDPAAGNNQIYVGRWELQLYNPSTTPCTSLEVSWEIVEENADFLEYHVHLNTSLGARKSRRVWVSNVGYDSSQAMPISSAFQFFNIVRKLEPDGTRTGYNEVYYNRIATR